VLHFGDHNVNAGVREYQGEDAYQQMVQEMTQTFSETDFPEIIRLLDKHFGTSTYSLKSLFRDEQRKVLDFILESTLNEIEAAYRQLYEHHFPSMRFLSDMGNPVPKTFQSAVEFILNIDLRRAFSSDTIEVERINSLLDEAKAWNAELDTEGLSYLLQQTLAEMMTKFASSYDDIDLLKGLVGATSLARSVPFSVDLWILQNIYYEMLRNTYPELKKRAQQGDTAATEWVTQFVSLGQQLLVRVA
jgi:hypothetical protein